MPRKALMMMLAFSLLFSVLLVFPFAFERPCKGQTNAIQQNSFRVRNLNTGKTYSTIQEAINAPETLDGHEIFVASGLYYEQVNVNKSLSLIGEDRSTTIIDGDGKGRIVYVTADNVVVRNFTLQNGTFGLWLDNSNNSKIVGNTLQNGTFGLWLDNSNNSKIVGNTLQDGSDGIRLYNSRNSEVTGNNVYRYTWFGVEIKASGNSTLRDNTMVDNKYNFGVNGKSLFDFINDIDVSNTVNGKPIHYLINQHNATIDAFTFQEMGYLALVNSSNIKVKNLNVQNNKQGILFAFTIDSSISNVNAENNWNGIYVAHSSNIALSRNNASDNFDYAIALRSSTNCTVAGNNANNNSWGGISLGSSWNCTVLGNNANNNYYGIHLVESGNNLVCRNNAYTRNDGYSIALYRSNNNTIYHNNFVNCLLHTAVKSKNTLDNGLEGNYWSFYRGVDADQDGIGDTPYTAGEDNVDNHPLMGKFLDFTVTLEEKNYSITVISNSTISHFQFSPDDARISFMATEDNETMSFSRIAVPNTLLQNLPGGNLSFLINDEQPVLKRKWTDETHTYMYLSYANGVSKTAISPWLIVAVAFIFLFVFMLVFLVLKKKKAKEG